MQETRKRNYILFFIAFAFYVLGSCFILQCFASPTSLPPDIKRILNNKKIVVALTAFDFPPFYEVDASGALVGTDIDMAKDIAHALGVALEFNRSAQSFDGVVDVVASRQATIAVSDLSATLSRAQKVMFTPPYIVYYVSLLINRLKYAEAEKTLGANQDLIAELMQSKIIIGTMKDSSYVDYARKMFPNAEIKQYSTLDETVTALLENKIDAYFFDDFNIRVLLLSKPEMGFKYRAIAFSNSQDLIAIAVNWRDKVLFEWVKLYLRTKHKKTMDTTFILNNRKMV